ncbi:Poly(A) polymerase gamma, partial [Brachionus plicatilis]
MASSKNAEKIFEYFYTRLIKCFNLCKNLTKDNILSNIQCWKAYKSYFSKNFEEQFINMLIKLLKKCIFTEELNLSSDKQMNKINDGLILKRDLRSELLNNIYAKIARKLANLFALDNPRNCAGPSIKIREATAEMNTSSSLSNLLKFNQSSSDQFINKSYGISLPLSTEYPTLKDKELTDKLEETLRKYNVFETDAELRHRMDVLHKINTLYKNWIKEISISKNMPEDVAEKVGGK